MHNKNIISDIGTIWRSIENKINAGIKINYDKFRFNSDIDIPLNTTIEFRSVLIYISCVIEKDNEYYPETYLDKCSYVNNKTNVFFQRMYKMNKVRELKIDNTLWATPPRIINLLDFNPEKLTIDKELNSIHNTPDASSKDLTDVHQVRYQNGGFYLTIDNIKGYFKLDDNISGILDMILTDDQKN